MRHVSRVKGYIAAGDIYQANIAHHLSASFAGDPIACANDLIRGASPRYGATMGFVYRGVHHTICSVSPELFVRVDRANGRIESEPMKGTRALEGDASELERNEKDRAELNMITDLMRNDLGRVCELGSVRVQQARKIEPHPSGVIQASSIVEGTLRDGVGIGELICATFPPGSVTGAPKVRAMQIIDELEKARRGPYGGGLGWIGLNGEMDMALALRTVVVPLALHDENNSSGSWVYHIQASGGIVADSVASAEYDETVNEAAALARAIDLADDAFA